MKSKPSKNKSTDAGRAANRPASVATAPATQANESLPGLALEFRREADSVMGTLESAIEEAPSDTWAGRLLIFSDELRRLIEAGEALAAGRPGQGTPGQAAAPAPSQAAPAVTPDQVAKRSLGFTRAISSFMLALEVEMERTSNLKTEGRRWQRMMEARDAIFLIDKMDQPGPAAPSVATERPEPVRATAEPGGQFKEWDFTILETEIFKVRSLLFLMAYTIAPCADDLYSKNVYGRGFNRLAVDTGDSLYGAFEAMVCRHRLDAEAARERGDSAPGKWDFVDTGYQISCAAALLEAMANYYAVSDTQDHSDLWRLASSAGKSLRASFESMFKPVVPCARRAAA